MTSIVLFFGLEIIYESIVLNILTIKLSPELFISVFKLSYIHCFNKMKVLWLYANAYQEIADGEVKRWEK